MSVRPVAFHADGSVDVIHDDVAPNHMGTVAAADLTPTSFGTLPDGTHVHNFLSLACPACAAVSLHPVGGGAAPAAVQELFVRLVARVGCPCGQVAAGASLPAALAHLKLQAQRMDGPRRWAIVGQLGPAT